MGAQRSINLSRILDKDFNRYPLEKGVFFTSLCGMSQVPHNDMTSCRWKYLFLACKWNPL